MATPIASGLNQVFKPINDDLIEQMPLDELTQLANKCLKSGDSQNATKLYKKLIEKDSEADPRVFSILVKLLFKTKNYEDAINYGVKAYQECSSVDYKLLKHLGLSCFYVKKEPDALYYLEASLNEYEDEDFGDRGFYYAYQGKLNFQIGQWDEADACYKKALKELGNDATSKILDGAIKAKEKVKEIMEKEIKALKAQRATKDIKNQ